MTLEQRYRKALVGLIGTDDPIVLASMIDDFEKKKSLMDSYDYEVSTNAMKLLIETNNSGKEFTD